MPSIDPSDQASLSPSERLSAEADERRVIPVIEERLKIDVYPVESGKVRISKEVHEEEVTVDVEALHEEVEVERIPLNQYVETPPPAVRYEGDTMIISVIREVAVVQKRLVLVEELRVKKRQVQTTTPDQVTLRKEEVKVERLSAESDNNQPQS